MNVVPYIALFERFWIDTTLGGVNAVTVCAAVGACVLLSNLMSFNSIVWKMTMDGMGKSVKWALRNYKSNISKPTYAIVTGASEGMGKEFAKELASAGYNVIIMARTQAKLDEGKKLEEKLYLSGFSCCFPESMPVWTCNFNPFIQFVSI